MDKQGIISSLETLKKNGAEIAEVIADISERGKVKHASESFIVRLVENPSNEDCIDNEKHWDLFDSISEFNDYTYYRHNADESYNIPYISDFKECKEFITDYTEVKVAV